MTEEKYYKIRNWFLRHSALLNIMNALNLWLPRIAYCVYPLLLVILAFHRDGRFLRVMLVPAFAFVTVTVMRQIWDFPRPYEKLDIEPLIAREKSGRSFPSRHMTSVTVIAAAFWYVYPPMGAVMTLIAILIGVIRPIAGIHFPRDIIAGAVLSLVIAVIGFWAI